MIKVTINEILNSIAVFREISNKSLPVKIAYQVARIIRELDKENTTFDETRKRIIETYCERDENGNMKITDEGNVILKNDTVEQCNKELEELLNTSLEINAELIQLDELEGINLTPNQILSISPFIQE